MAQEETIGKIIDGCNETNFMFLDSNPSIGKNFETLKYSGRGVGGTWVKTANQIKLKLL